MLWGSSCQSCLPRGFVRSSGSSSTRTTSRCCGSAPDELGDVERPGHVPAGVLASVAAVDPDPCAVINRAKMQNQTFGKLAWRRLEGPPIPADRDVASVPDAAGRRLGAERNTNPMRPLHIVDSHGFAGVDRKVPVAVE